MRSVVAVLIGILMFVVLVGAAQAGYMGVVKAAKNADGQMCSEIPEVLEAEFGCKVVSAKWSEEKMSGASEVSLKLSVHKQKTADEVYVSYAWNPVWVWKVEHKTRRVKPINKLAVRWMEGKI